MIKNLAIVLMFVCSPLYATGIPGDFNMDGVIDHVDVDELAANVGSTDPLYDLDGDGIATFTITSANGVDGDSDYLIRTIKNTQYGDNNLDGEIDILDLDLFGQGWQGADPGWLFGDYDGSGEIDIIDLDLFGQFYDLPPTVAAALMSLRSPCVPEPETISLATLAALAFLIRKRK